MKLPLLITITLIACRGLAQDPCGEVLFGTDVPSDVYPTTFLEDILVAGSPCVYNNNPTYGVNSITLDNADLIPCAGDVLSGLWVEAPNHDPLCVYTYPLNAAVVLGTEFLGDLLVGNTGFFIAIVGVPIGGVTVDNYVSIGYIPVNPTYNDTLKIQVCDPDSSGLVVTEHLISQCGCDSVVTRVYYYEEVTLAIDGPEQICYGDTTALTAAPSVSGNYHYSWSTGDTTKTIPLFDEGLYDVTVTNSAGCVYTASHVTGFYPISHLVIEAPQTICIGETIYLIEDSGYDPYLWTLPDGTGLTGSEVGFTATDAHTGVYYLKGIDYSGCVVKDSAWIEVEHPVDLPSFPDIETCIGDTLGIYFSQALIDTSTFYEWVNGRDYSYEPNRPWIIKRNWGGTNYIRATTSAGCVSETSFHLSPVRCKTYCDSILVYFPNAFSPNSNGLNDRYIIGGNCAELLVRDFLVFDRWGGILFEQHDFCPDDPAYGWDGTAGGRIVQAGVYAFMAWVTDVVTGKSCLREGSITVLPDR
ncbi:MAG: gliding motility-associated C-terminal domain-containing protein [Lewinellaceae bacterium]|nr:gliding motility-associated C-terminal domain-containing protein [Lewinellaceae bacterium]